MSMYDDFSSMLPSCCNLAAVPIRELAERERQFFASFMPDAATAIVIGHHILTEEEWTWYSRTGGEQRCDADDHLRGLCKKIKGRLAQNGYQSNLVKYPAQSGLQFRFVAQAAELGMGSMLFCFIQIGVLGSI